MNKTEFVKLLAEKMETSVVDADKNLKLVVITNNNDNEIFLNAIDLQVNKFLFKNQAFSELNNYIKSIKIKNNEQKNEQTQVLIN